MTLQLPCFHCDLQFCWPYIVFLHHFQRIIELAQYSCKVTAQSSVTPYAMNCSAPCHYRLSSSVISNKLALLSFCSRVQCASPAACSTYHLCSQPDTHLKAGRAQSFKPLSFLTPSISMCNHTLLSKHSCLAETRVSPFLIPSSV